MTEETSQEQPDAARPRVMARLVRKELRETLRDRRTALTLVMMPVLLYPLLGLLAERFLFVYASEAAVESESIRLGFEDISVAGVLKQLLAEGDKLLDAEEPKKEDENKVEEKKEPLSGDDEFEWLEADAKAPSLEKLVKEGQVDAAIRLVEQGPPPQFQVIVQEGSRYGERAVEALNRRLNAVRDAATEAELQRAGVQPWPKLVAVERVGEPSKQGQAPAPLAVIPLILLLMTATGAVYPAIDLTAGERERGTLETLAATPLAPIQVLFAKYVAVASVSLLTGMVNLAAMLGTLYALGMEQIFFGETGPAPSALILIVLLLGLFAAFFSALVLCVSSFARSFKEAQAYLIPLMIAALAPGAASLLPDLQLTFSLAAAPVLNLVLLARDILTGAAAPGPAAAALLATCLYAAAALGIAAQVFTRASMEFGDTDWKSLLGARSGGRPGVEAGATATALVLAAYLYLSGAPQRMTDDISGMLIGNAAVIIIVFALLPIAFARWGQWRFRDTFGMYPPRPTAVAAALVLGACAWPIAYEITASLTSDRLPQLEEQFRTLKDRLGAVPLPLRIATLAVVPAICEEFFFRGLLLGALRGSLGVGATIAVSAGLFGVFHVLAPGSLLLERLAPSTYMGLLLGVVRIRTGSLWPGILMHALYNSILLSLNDLSPLLDRLGLGSVANSTHLPWPWLAASAGGFALAAWLLSVAQPVGPTDQGGEKRPALDANSLS